MTQPGEKDMTQRQLRSLITDYVTKYQEPHATKTGWKSPLTAFAGAHDPLFRRLKKIIGPTHALPRDFLPDAETALAFFIPFEQSVAESNRENRNCSKEWAAAYIETNRLIYDLNTHIRDCLEIREFDTTIIPATHNFDPKSLTSGWSHRHIAFIAGLGTFGINNMLITEKGCCGRIGGIVTNAAVGRTRKDGHELCLYKYNGSCGKCTERCVVYRFLLSEKMLRHVPGKRQIPFRYGPHRCVRQVSDRGSLFI